jgi:hypothetical protein
MRNPFDIIDKTYKLIGKYNVRNRDYMMCDHTYFTNMDDLIVTYCSDYMLMFILTTDYTYLTISYEELAAIRDSLINWKSSGSLLWDKAKFNSLEDEISFKETYFDEKYCQVATFKNPNIS